MKNNFHSAYNTTFANLLRNTFYYVTKIIFVKNNLFLMNNLLSVIMKNPFYTKYFIQNLLRNKNLCSAHLFMFSSSKSIRIYQNIDHFRWSK